MKDSFLKKDAPGIPFSWINFSFLYFPCLNYSYISHFRISHSWIKYFWVKYFFALHPFVLFLLCLSCTAKFCPEWHLSKCLSSYSPCYNFARLHYPADNSSDSLEIELDHTMSGLRMYVNVFSLPLTPYPADSSSFPVRLKLGGKEKIFEGTLLQGNQRVLLPAEAREYFTAALLEGNDIEVSAGRYKGYISADHFWKLFNEFQSLPLP